MLTIRAKSIPPITAITWLSKKRDKVLPDTHVWEYRDGNKKEPVQCHIVRCGFGGPKKDRMYCEIQVLNSNKYMIVDKDFLRWVDAAKNTSGSGAPPARALTEAALDPRPLT